MGAQNNPWFSFSQTESSLTAFHLGVVFILLGFLMIFSSMIPSSVVDADWSRLLGVGVCLLIVGLMMVMVNRIISAREEEELQRYVSTRLGRTRSGQVMCRDPESQDDIMLIRHSRRRVRASKQLQQLPQGTAVGQHHQLPLNR